MAYKLNFVKVGTPTIVDKVVSGNVMMHQVSLDTGYVIRSNFNSKDNNKSTYHQFDSNTGSWLDFTIYEN